MLSVHTSSVELMKSIGDANAFCLSDIHHTANTFRDLFNRTHSTLFDRFHHLNSVLTLVGFPATFTLPTPNKLVEEELAVGALGEGGDGVDEDNDSVDSDKDEREDSVDELLYKVAESRLVVGERRKVYDKKVLGIKVVAERIDEETHTFDEFVNNRLPVEQAKKVSHVDVPWLPTHDVFEGCGW